MTLIRQRIQEEKRAEHTVLTMPSRAFKYHLKWLALAEDYYELTKEFVINPRNLQAGSLHEADIEWMNDYGRYIRLKRFEKERIA